MKRVISLVLCLFLVVSLATCAVAATVSNGTTHAFKAYQIFTGTQTEADASLGEIDWGTGVNGPALLTALKASSATGTYFASIDDSAANAAELVADVLAHADTPLNVIKHFAQLAYNNKSTVYTDIAANATEVSLNPGYYLIVDATEDVAAGDALNPALLQVTNAGPITIAKKYDVPEPDKFTIADDTGDTSNHVEAEDTPIGKPVEFHLKADMPLNMEGFEKYTMTFHDSLSAGLDFNNDVKVYVGDTTTPIDAKYYTVSQNTEETADFCAKDEADKICDFHVVIEDVMVIPGYAAGCEVVVKYTATVNEDALIDSPNPNDFRLEYSNDPNWDPDLPDSGNNPTGVSPWNDAKVWSTQVEIRKVDGTTDLPLTGAEFTLTGPTGPVVKVTKNEFVAYAAGETVDDSNKYWALKNGTYTTLDPANPEMDKTAYVDPDAEGNYTLYYSKTTSSFVGEGKAETTMKAVVGPDGTVKFGGLGEGTYTIVESVVPDSYNGLKEPLTLTIVFNELTETFEYSWSGGATGSGSSIKVDNMKGSVLPETGGMGTTLFYVIGGLMVAASAVLLVTKKRMITE